MRPIYFPEEYKKSLYNCYIIYEDAIMKVVDERDEEELTVENFKVMLFNAYENKRCILTVYDFRFYNPNDNDFDYMYNEESDEFISRDRVPEEVRDLLDRHLNINQYK